MRKLVEETLNDWGDYLRGQFPSDKHFLRYLYSLGVQVDIKTAARWYNGNTLPSTARIIEMAVSGFDAPYHIIFERASLAGDHAAREAKVNELEQSIAALQQQLKELQG